MTNRQYSRRRVTAQSTWKKSAASMVAAGPVQPGLGLGAAQHGNLVPQHEQFDVLGRGGPAVQDQPAAEPGEDQVESRRKDTADHHSR